MPLHNYLDTIADDLRDSGFALEYPQLGRTDGLPTFILYLWDVATGNIGMTRLAKITGMSRESSYKAFSSTRNPRLDAVRKVLQALGCEFKPDNSCGVGRGGEAAGITAEPIAATV